MTKKSMARQMRDKQKEEFQDNLDKSMKNHPIWDEVANLSQQILTLIASYATSGDVVQMPEISAEIKDHKSLVSNLSIMAMDLRNVTGDVMQLRAAHANKTGSAKTPEEHMAGIQIHQEYVTIMERIEGVIQPVYLDLMRQIQEAETAAREKNKDFANNLNEIAKQVHEVMTQEPQLRPEQDPNVITDVVVIDKN
jgi:hypothetical protein